MNIYLYYTFEIGLLILIIIAIVVAFREATREDGEPSAGADESSED